MKRNLLFLVAVFGFLFVQAQVKVINNRTVPYNIHRQEERIKPGTTAIHYWPKDFLKDVSVFCGIDSVHGRTFGLLLHLTDKFFSKLDSVSIKSKNGSRIVITDLLKDSAVVANSGNYFFMPEFSIDSKSINFFLENKVQEMELFFEKRQTPVKIRIKRRFSDAIMKII